MLDQIARNIPASAWVFTDAALDRWPVPVQERAVSHVRALPPGKERIEALCGCAHRLTVAEQREALAGILDGTLPETSREHTKPISYSHVIADFVRTLPEAWQEEWIATKAPDVFREVLAREALDRFTEVATRRSLPDDDQREAVEALVASVIRAGRFYTVESRWGLLPDDALAPLLIRLRQDDSGWSRDEIITHLVEERDPALADRRLRPLLDGLSDLDADHCAETVHALTPWLADRSDGAVPRALAALPVPVPGRGASPIYRVERALGLACDQAAD